VNKEMVDKSKLLENPDEYLENAKEEIEGDDFNFDLNFNLEVADDINLDDYDLSIEVSAIESRFTKPKFQKVKTVKYERAEELVKDFGTIQKNDRIFAIVSGNFVAGDLIEALIVKNNWYINTLEINILSLSWENFGSLKNLLTWVDKNGIPYVQNLKLIVSDFFYAHEKHKLLKDVKIDMQDLFEDGRIELAVCRTHLKSVIFKTECGLFVNFFGSANLRSSNNIEQISIEENEDLYNFQKGFNDNIFEDFSIFEKPLTKLKTWQAISKINENEQPPKRKKS
jgi:hypothetical protein